MISFVKNIFLFLLFVLSSCSNSRIDKKFVEKVLRKEISIKGNLSTKELAGGYSENLVYFSTDGKDKYIVKFFKNISHGIREIYNSQVASKDEAGPKVYFADPSKGILVMEYLSTRKISEKDLLPLAVLLQKIHKGNRFDNYKYDPFKRIEDHIQLNQSKSRHILPLIEMEEIVKNIHQILIPYLIEVPCHNDLHLDNLMFLEKEVKAIDYMDAGQNDPYYDVATVASTAFVYANPLHEKVLFEAYLGYQPSAKEKAKLYLMKQIVLIKWALDALDRVSEDDISKYSTVDAVSLQDIAISVLEKDLNMSDPEHNLIFLKAIIHQILKNVESKEFYDAVTLLRIGNVK